MPTMATNGLAVAVPPTPENYYENGRVYHGFRRGIYLYPCDESEKDRMDLYHKLFEVARKGHLHQAPFTAPPPPYEPSRVLDLGCGTGIWALDMADKYPNAEVVGLDLVNIQPVEISPNLRFRVGRDYEGYWALGEDSWDLIHLQMASGSVSHWPDLYQKIFTHLKPGHGWIEQVEVDLQPRCDDHTLPENCYLRRWYDYLADATARYARPIAYNHNTRQMLQHAGFIDIQETIIRAPYTTWPSDPHQKEISKWYNLGITEGLEALSLAPFTRVYRWKAKEDVEPLIEQVRKEMCTRKYHAYNNIHIWTARRPVQ